MKRSARERLRQFYDRFAGEDTVLMPITADPDAIASAMAVKRLLWRKVSSVTIANTNIIERPDNLAMIRLLKVTLNPIDQITPQRFRRVVLVDAQPSHHPFFQQLTPDVIIDHHPKSNAQAPFVDIRPHYGATATIMTEYLRAAKIKPSAKLATGLCYAIKTDTRSFERQTQPEDVRAFQFLFRFANVHLTRKIEQAELRLSFLKYFERALKSYRLHKNRIIAYLGPVTNADVCVLIADFFMRVNSVTWSVVAGTCGPKLIIILRNDGARRDAGTVAKRSFGTLGSAGGHKSMARAEIGLEALEKQLHLKDEQRIVRWLVNTIEKRAGKN